jgi:antitoxin component of MazEF toxin-antitoxin module
MRCVIKKVTQIGNSRGILFPKAILDEYGFFDIVKITVKNKTIVITPCDNKRKRTWSYFERLKGENLAFL